MKNKPTFKTELEALLIRLGAIEGQDIDALGYRFTFACTVGGPLHCTPCDTALHCHFQWPRFAYGRVSGAINPHSGKWNWYPESATPTAADIKRIESALAAIVYAFPR
jgi:hypothetical protein